MKQVRGPTAAEARKRRDEIERNRLETARNVWDKLPAKEQQRVIKELVESRAAEMRLAYPHVLGVGYGSRARRIRGQRRLTDERCVVFMVSQKWKKGSRLERSKTAVPRHLLSYCDLRGRRRLCAVPTDIESARDYRDVGACAGGSGYLGVYVPGGPQQEIGAAACVVKVPQQTGIYLLGCLHVCGLFKHFPSIEPPRLEAAPVSSTKPPAIDRGSPFAELSSIRGFLRDGDPGSFDCALMRVTDVAGLTASVGTSGAALFATEPGDIDATLVVRTPRGEMRCTRRGFWKGLEKVIPYQTQREGRFRISHADLVEYSGRVRDGDSGSAVVSPDGSRFLGVHIAGSNRARIGFMIPSYQVLNTDNYPSVPLGKWLKIDGRFRF